MLLNMCCMERSSMLFSSGRWAQCKQLTRAQQQLQTGPHALQSEHARLWHSLHEASDSPPSPTWFLLRVPFHESFQDSLCRVFVMSTPIAAVTRNVLQDLKYSRLQRRLIHRVAQMAEGNLSTVLQSRLPTLRTDDVLHPCAKLPGCFYLECTPKPFKESFILQPSSNQGTGAL